MPLLCQSQKATKTAVHPVQKAETAYTQFLISTHCIGVNRGIVRLQELHELKLLEIF